MSKINLVWLWQAALTSQGTYSEKNVELFLIKNMNFYTKS